MNWIIRLNVLTVCLISVLIEIDKILRIHLLLLFSSPFHFDKLYFIFWNWDETVTLIWTFRFTRIGYLVNWIYVIKSSNKVFLGKEFLVRLGGRLLNFDSRLYCPTVMFPSSLFLIFFLFLILFSWWSLIMAYSSLLWNLNINVVIFWIFYQLLYYII